MSKIPSKHNTRYLKTFDCLVYFCSEAYHGSQYIIYLKNMYHAKNIPKFLCNHYLTELSKYSISQSLKYLVWFFAP